MDSTDNDTLSHLSVSQDKGSSIRISEMFVFIMSIPEDLWRTDESPQLNWWTFFTVKPHVRCLGLGRSLERLYQFSELLSNNRLRLVIHLNLRLMMDQFSNIFLPVRKWSRSNEREDQTGVEPQL